jgi:hypothetical protein
MRSSILGLLTALVLAALGAGPASAWYPRTAQAELVTATWCANCEYADLGLEANKGWFDPNAFNVIRYFAPSGGLGSAASLDRITYYDGRFPESIFDGSARVPRGDVDLADGLYFRDLIDRQLCEPSHFKITVNSVDFTGPEGSIDLTVEVMEDLSDITNLFLRMILTEDNTDYLGTTHHDVTRDSIGGWIPITISTEGQTQNVNETFTINPLWTESELDIIAFIQDDDDESVLASASTEASSDYTLRYYALDPRAVVGPITAHHHYPALRIYNLGIDADVFYFNVDTDGPPGWIGVLCEGAECIGPYHEAVLYPGEYVEYYIDMQAATSGYGTATLLVSQDARPAHIQRIKYSYITDDMSVLLVDDDGARSHEDYFIDALEHYGHSYGVWDHNAHGTPPAAVMAGFSAVIWSHARADLVLDAEDRAELGTYLDGGGNLFITGQDLGAELDGYGGDAYQWYQDYMHATFTIDDSEDFTLDGVPGDVISGGINLTVQGGDGADNQTSLDDIDPADGSATVIYTYDTGENAALRVDTGTYRVVYFAFGFEAIDNASQRRGLLHRILGYFNGLMDTPDQPTTFRPALSITPNPISGPTTVRFTLPAPEKANLRVYGLDGRLLRTLAAGPMSAGNHTVTWDRNDAHGQRLPAGIYYCRLEGERTDLARKVVFLK